MVIFDSDITRGIEELGYEVRQKPESGAEVQFLKDSHKIEIYLSDGEWFIFSESTNRQKAEDGYYMHESIGLSVEEFMAIEDILDKAGRRLKDGG